MRVPPAQEEVDAEPGKSWREQDFFDAAAAKPGVRHVEVRFACWLQPTQWQYLRGERLDVWDTSDWPQLESLSEQRDAGKEEA